MRHPGRLAAASLLLVLGLAGNGCTPGADATVPPLSTRADSVAMRAYEAVGGPEVWAELPYLRFEFAASRGGERRPGVHHLWDRITGRYRVEMPAGGDTLYVALFDVTSGEGQAYLDGAPLDAARSAEVVERAYRRFINDTYWLLVPTKLFDPGVHRAYVPDSSDADTDVIALTFDDVGLTPGDRYWIYVDRATGRVERWAYHLQSFGPEQPATQVVWTDYVELDTPAGRAVLATRKDGGAFTIHTDGLETPAEVPDALFTDPAPRLAPNDV